MTVVATRLALAIVVGCIAGLLIAIVLRSPTTMALCCGVLIGLAGVWLSSMPAASRLRRERLQFTWTLMHSASHVQAGAVVPGMPFVITCKFVHRAPEALRLTNLSAIVPGDVTVLEPLPSELWIEPDTAAYTSFTLVAKASGRVVLQGLAANLPGPLSLFEAPLYFPQPVTVKIMPRATIVKALRPHGTHGHPVERSTRTMQRRSDGGTELRELRELQPGDPFKSIAWKASARSGRLLVREVEREVQRTAVIVVDVSGTMRGGDPGQRKLDFALDLAAMEARRSLDRGDRVGLLTVDGRVLADVPPADGMRQMIAINDALLAATEVVDLDLTDDDDDDVLQIVGAYLRQQDGIECWREDRWDKERMIAHASAALIHDPTPRPAIVAGDPGTAVLRRFCRKRGIPLRYRADTRADGKGVGLARALRTAGGDTRMPRSITMITDLDGVSPLDVFTKPLLLMRRLRHEVLFVMPQPAPISDRGGTIDQAIIRVYEMQEARRTREALSFLGKLGVPVITMSAGMLPVTSAVRAQRGRSAA